jgi:hypothetical protein
MERQQTSEEGTEGQAETRGLTLPGRNRLTVAGEERPCGQRVVAALRFLLDGSYERFTSDDETSEAICGAPAAELMASAPSEYWHRNCSLGASFLRPGECGLRHEIGVDRITEALRYTFAGGPVAEVAAMVGGNAARVYGFDPARLAPVVARVGPQVDVVATPLEEVPAGATSPGFVDEPYARSW